MPKQSNHPPPRTKIGTYLSREVARSARCAKGKRILKAAERSEQVLKIPAERFKWDLISCVVIAQDIFMPSVATAVAKSRSPNH